MVFAVVTSHRNTERSPPQDANLALSLFPVSFYPVHASLTASHLLFPPRAYLLGNTNIQNLIPMGLKFLHQFPTFHSSAGSSGVRAGVIQTDAFVA